MIAMDLVCSTTLSILDHGYHMEWNEKGEVPHLFQGNHTSAFSDAGFITDAIETGVAQGTMKEVDRDFLTCILPLGIATHARTGKKRLIYDARLLNEYLISIAFKMESLHIEGRALFQSCAWGGTCDLSQAYYHVDIHEEHQTFLGFEWEGKFYCYTVLPFGLSTAPRIFTKIMKTPVAHLRSLGCKLIAYLDDIPFAHDSFESAAQHGLLIVKTLKDFGWIIQPTKCVGIGIPLQPFEVLGVLVDLQRKMFYMP